MPWWMDNAECLKLLLIFVGGGLSLAGLAYAGGYAVGWLALRLDVMRKRAR